LIRSGSNGRAVLTRHPACEILYAVYRLSGHNKAHAL
jgi:hypothetical protein